MMKTTTKLHTGPRAFARRRGAGAAALLLLLAQLLGSCAVNPATGGANLVLMTESRELEVGAEEHQKILNSMPVYEDEALAAYVQEVGERVAEVSHRSDIDYTFTVIDSPDINAFALPGGYVYINRGLLAYLNSEAELAAVLAHEIGHITARHGVQQQARGKFANAAAGVGGVVAAVATGSGYIGSQISQVTSIWAASGLSGYGREHELEADGLGAEYLYKAGYDPQAMIDVITVLKNQEDFNTKVANRRSSYHGVFATHPRNDTRLHQAVAQVGALEEGELREVDGQLFRERMSGLPMGERQRSGNGPDRNRYYQQLLGYTLVLPDEWRITETPTTVTASSPSSAASLSVEVRRLNENREPRLFIREELGIENLQKSQPLSQFRLLGHTGVYSNSQTGETERIAVLYMGPRAFILRGRSGEAGRLDDELDRVFQASIASFRSMQRGERVSGNEPKIRYVQASEFFDFSVLAQRSRIAQYPEETLRLLNGYYPTGTPEAGEWIKTIE